MILKVLSWNIWFDGDFEKIAAFLKSANADIIGLQEVVPDDPRRDTTGFLRTLGYDSVVAPVKKIKDGRTMSNGVFSKYKIIGENTYSLSKEENRIAIFADIDVNGTILHAGSTHLLHTHQQPSPIQEEQGANLLRTVPNERAIIMGDFNATPDSAVIGEMRRALVDTHLLSTPTLDSRSFDCKICPSETIPTIRLDYIFTTPDIRSYSFQVGTSHGSDHLPVWVEIEI